MKMRYWKRAVKLLALFLALLLLVLFLQGFVFRDFWQQGQGSLRILGFYREPRDSLDVVLIGDSTVYAGYSPVLAYERRGFTSYNLAIGANVCTTWRPLTEEILREQDPQLIVVDIGGIQYDSLQEKYDDSSTIHVMLDNMPLSVNRLRTIRELTARYGDDPLEYLLPFIRYHNEWAGFGELWEHFYEMYRWRFVSGNVLKGTVARTSVEQPLREGTLDVREDTSQCDLAPESEEVLRAYLAYCRERQGQTDKAMELYNGLIMKEPDAETLFLRGRLNLRKERDRAAEQDFDQAVSIDPSYELYINIYELYADVDKSGDGARYLEEALLEASRNTTDYYSQGLVNYYLQNYDEAREKLIAALNAAPDDARAVFLLGKIDLSSGDIANARAVFGAGLDNESTSAAAHNGLALCDLEEGQYESALEHVQKGLESGDSYSEQGLRYNEIVICEHLHDWTAATRKVAEYVTRYPSDEAGLREYEYLSSR